MTIWNARRSGNRILCGQAGCGDILAHLPTVPARQSPDGALYLLFRPFYEPANLLEWAAATLWAQDNPHPPEDEPVTVLRIGTYAAAKIARGQKPTRRPFRPGKYDSAEDAARAANQVTQIVTLDDGTEEEGKGWTLPVVLPCVHHHVNRIDAPTASGVE